jgi:hypothetical protein
MTQPLTFIASSCSGFLIRLVIPAHGRARMTGGSLVTHRFEREGFISSSCCAIDGRDGAHSLNLSSIESAFAVLVVAGNDAWQQFPGRRLKDGAQCEMLHRSTSAPEGHPPDTVALLRRRVSSSGPCFGRLRALGDGLRGRSTPPRRDNPGDLGWDTLDAAVNVSRGLGT